MIIASKQFGLAVLHGLIAIFLLEIVSSLIFSLILKLSSVQESGLQVIITAASFISLFAGGFISGGKEKKRAGCSG